MLLLDEKELDTLKTLIASNDKMGQATIAELLKAADKALNNPLYSVTFFKDSVAPSGDKRDYISMGPYWWPNPNTTSGKPYIRRDGEINPEREKLHDYYQMMDMINDVEKLSLASFFTSKKIYSVKAEKLLQTWFINTPTKMNPHLNYGQGIPGITQGRGIGIIETRALTAIPDALALLQRSSGLQPQTIDGVKKWFSQYLNWVITSKIGLEEKETKNNHGTYYDVQVMNFALFTGKPELAKNILKEKTIARIDTQFQTDGSLPLEQERSRSWHYTGMNSLGWVQLALMAEKIGFDLWNYKTSDNKNILKTLKYPGSFLLKNKQWPHRQIVEDRNDELFLAYIIAAKHYNDDFFVAIKNKFPLHDWLRLWLP